MFAFSVSPSSLKTAPKSAQKMDRCIQEHLGLSIVAKKRTTNVLKKRSALSSIKRPPVRPSKRTQHALQIQPTKSTKKVGSRARQNICNSRDGAPFFHPCRGAAFSLNYIKMLTKSHDRRRYDRCTTLTFRRPIIPHSLRLSVKIDSEINNTLPGDATAIQIHSVL